MDSEDEIAVKNLSIGKRRKYEGWEEVVQREELYVFC